jgi:hypothetical protein
VSFDQLEVIVSYFCQCEVCSLRGYCISQFCPVRGYSICQVCSVKSLKCFSSSVQLEVTVCVRFLHLYAVRGCSVFHSSVSSPHKHVHTNTYFLVIL